MGEGKRWLVEFRPIVPDAKSGVKFRGDQFRCDQHLPRQSISRMDTSPARP